MVSRDNSIQVKKEEKVVWMAMGPERSSSSSSKPLHNFTLPCGLRWGNQRFLRCMKVNSNGEISAVERRPSSTSSVPAVSNANANNTNSHASGSNDFISIIGKRKEREKFKDLPPPSDHRRGSDYKKAGFNFKLPPAPSQQPSFSATDFCRKFRSSETGGGGDGDRDGIAAVREKLMFDLQTAADKMKDAILRDGLETEDQDNPPSPAPAAAPTVAATVASSEDADASVRPWNLRTRRAACKAPTANGFVPGSAGGAGTSGSGGTNTTASPMKGLKVDVMKPNPNSSPLRAENNKSPRLTLRSGVATAAAAPRCEKKEKVKFSVPLTRREIEEDFLAFAGRRPPRRPQKRPKYVQKQLDTLFPGLWLTEITADMYKVPETQ